MIGIYKITNKLNNKSYIGQSIHCGKRLDEHYKGNQFIDQAIQLNGIENFTFEVLKETELENLSYWEDYYIIKYDTMFPKGYNKKWNCSSEIRNSIIHTNKEVEIKQDKQKSYITRNIPFLDYQLQSNAIFTKKQYLVYSYLISISKNKTINQNHIYYINKNSFLTKDACELLKISQPTWRKALDELKQESYLIEQHDQFILNDLMSTVPLDIKLIKLLLQIGTELSYGSIVILYATLYQYFELCKEQEDECEITVSKLSHLFDAKRTKTILSKYRIMISIFGTYNLISYKPVHRHYNNIDYIAYKIEKVELSLPEDLNEQEINVTTDISKIIETLETDLNDLN